MFCGQACHGEIDLPQNGARFVEEVRPGIGQPDGASAVFEQGDTQFFLQIPDLAAQGRLGNL